MTRPTVRSRARASCTVSSYFGAYLTLRVRVQATFTGGAKGNPSSCSMNESGRDSAGRATGVGLLSSRALASAAYACPMMPAASSPEMSGVRQAANFDRGSAKPCCSA